MRHLVQTLVRDTLGRTGRTVRDIEIAIDWDGDDVYLSRAHIGHEWSGDSGIGHTKPVRKRIKGDWHETKVEHLVTGFVEKAIALTDRQRVIADHLDGDIHPAWSILMERCALSIVRYAGWRDGDLLRFRHPQSLTQRYAVGDNGFWMAPDLPDAIVNGERISLKQLGLSGGVLRANTLRFGPADRVAYYHGGRVPRIDVGSATVPETMIRGMTGLPIDDLVDHPAITGCGAAITSARQMEVDGKNRLVINLARQPVAMACAPEGVDVSWLDVLARN